MSVWAIIRKQRHQAKGQDAKLAVHMSSGTLYPRTWCTWYSLCLVTLASIIQIYPGPFWLLQFDPAQLPYCAACSKVQNHVYIIYKKIKIGNYIWKNRFWDFSIFTFSYLEQNADAWGPIFLRTIYSQHTYKVRYDSRITATSVQLWNVQPRKWRWWEGRKRRYACSEDCNR